MIQRRMNVRGKPGEWAKRVAFSTTFIRFQSIKYFFEYFYEVLRDNAKTMRRPNIFLGDANSRQKSDEQKKVSAGDEMDILGPP